MTEREERQRRDQDAIMIEAAVVEGLRAEVERLTAEGKTWHDCYDNERRENERLLAERDKAWTKHLIEREELKAEIKHLNLLDEISKRHIELLEQQLERLKAERHTTKEMLEDVLRRHGVLPSETPHYGPGRAGTERKNIVSDD